MGSICLGIRSLPCAPALCLLCLLHALVCSRICCDHYSAIPSSDSKSRFAICLSSAPALYQSPPVKLSPACRLCRTALIST
ncbi:hypothetical protein GDO81_000497 [Engystomops pustulosus]|uniref:Secreted protein n=1 Tax=Engystomops pustulosus TaxID=76066 RepID=A0AAV7D4Q1_ENGPU|nr:hypothetical protein GDO81_000497 [Engystomops pustulosus]